MMLTEMWKIFLKLKLHCSENLKIHLVQIANKKENAE